MFSGEKISDYLFDLIVKKGNTVLDTGQINGFDNTPSINDSGTVAIVGKFNSGESLLVGDGQSAALNISDNSASNFRSGVEINNNNQVVAVDLAGNASAIRLWSVANSGSFFTNVGTGKYPSSGYDFENIFSYPSLSNNIQEVIASDTQGFSSIGRAPGISDISGNSQAVAFYGDNAGEGIFVSIRKESENGSQLITKRIAGIAGNGVLDPGETYVDK